MSKNATNKYSAAVEATKSRMGEKLDITPADTTTPTPKIDAKVAKSKDPNYYQATLYLSKKLHKRLKTAGLISDRDISDISEQAIEQFLDVNFPDT